MRPRSSCVCVFLIVSVSSGGAVAAELGKRFDSWRDMHDGTQYGSLFLNEGSIRLQDSRSRKRFVEINGSGELNLSPQEGYCFVFNHYGSSSGNGISQKYRLKISKAFTDGRSNTEENLAEDFSPTDNVVSSRLPDWCVGGLLNVSKVSLQFSSDDGYFNRAISIPIK